MAICFKSFLERAPDNLQMRWTSIFMRADGSEHEVVVDCMFSQGLVRLPVGNYYSTESISVSSMRYDHENITSFSSRNSAISGIQLYVKTLIDTRHN